jgi:flagellar assembly protein FliH
VQEGRLVQVFDWSGATAGAHLAPAFVTYAEPVPIAPSPGDLRTAHDAEGGVVGADHRAVASAVAHESEAELRDRTATIEREAFAQGYAAGERSGAEAGAQRADALIRRLSATLDDLANLRRTIASQAEHDLVRLALAVARRVVHREIQLDPQLVAALAHVALDRLDAGRGPALLKMHPEDIERLKTSTTTEWAQSAIRLMPDSSVARGGCVVETSHGRVDATVDRQFAEIAHALLGEPGAVAAEARPAA